MDRRRQQCEHRQTSLVEHTFNAKRFIKQKKKKLGENLERRDSYLTSSSMTAKVCVGGEWAEEEEKNNTKEEEDNNVE